MEIQSIKCSLAEIKQFRVLFLHENNFQFVHDKCHLYGWADTYRLLVDGVAVGYGSIWGLNERQERDCIFEFYVLPHYRQHAPVIFRELIASCKPAFIECQTNDPLLASMVFHYAENINAESVLFKDHHTSTLAIPGARLVKKPVEKDFNPNDVAYLLEMAGETVATGGFMLNYNIPYADIYMDVTEGFRGKGYGSFIVQELKKEIYRTGRVPAARCNINNNISRSTLLKAGFAICGHWIKGQVKKF